MFAEAQYEVGEYEDTLLIHETREYINTKPEKSSAKAMQHLDKLENVVLNIAVTGESGVGKSAFVNALRGLRHGDKGAADTGVTETTMKAIRYSHPTMPNVYIWDLPGIGTPNFKAKRYLKDVHFDTFDFFIIISSVRFKENDIVLAQEIKRMKKMFYFVRSKIDNDVRTESEKKDYNEDQMLSKIRLSCQDNLKDLGNPMVFLISTYDLGKYDFQKLVDSLEKNLPEHKRFALIQSMPVCSEGMVEKKRKVLIKKACAAAAGAGATAAIVVPGLSIGVGFGVTLGFLQKAHVAFGLDELSIHRLSERVNKPTYALTSVMKSRFAAGVTEKVVREMLKTEAMVAAKTIEFILSGIAGCGSLAAMGLSFATTLHLLSEGINEMAVDANAVLKVAIEDFPQ